MITKLKAWGNSQAIRIPKEMLQEAGFCSDDDLDIEVKNESITITKVHRRLSLEERIRQYGPIRDFPETDWGEPLGDEIW